MELKYHQEAVRELSEVPPRERRAIRHVLDLLACFGSGLGAGYTKGVKRSSCGIRELRPRAGHSPWRVLYRQVGQVMVLLAVVHDAEASEHDFNVGVDRAEERLAAWPQSEAP